MRHIIPISGKDSLATALVQKAKEPDLPYEYVFNPTGSEYPSVYEWIDRVEAYLGSPIARVGENLMEIIEDNNYFLPSAQARYCTRQAKIEPFERWIGKDEATVYYGIRADENRQGYVNASGRITSVMPLAEAGLGIFDVYRIISDAGLKPPTFFWQTIYDSLCRTYGESTIKANFLEWQIDYLFAGRTRANCYHCYNQRLYEWVWLLETYPDLFWNSERMEHLGGDKKFTWNRGKSLQEVAEQAEAIKLRRIKQLRKIIGKSLQSGFEFPSEEAAFLDIFNTTSCGLFCGK